MATRSISVRQALLGVILSVAIPLIALAVLLMRQSLTTERNAITNGHLAAARSLAALVENEIETHVALAATLASSSALVTGDLADFHRQATEVAQSALPTWIALSDRSGKVLLSSLKPFGEALPQREASALASAAVLSSRGPYLTDVLQGEVSGRHVAILEHPVIINAEIAYTISVVLHPENFRKLLAEKFGREAAVAVIDRQRRFVARIPDHEARVGTPAALSWRQEIEKSPQEGFAETVTLEGVPSLTSYAATRYGWIAGISYPLASLYAPVTRQLWLMVSLGGTLVLMAIAIAYAMARRITAPAAALVEDARHLAEGKVVGATRFGLREADEISEAISHSSRLLRQRLDDLDLAQKHQGFLLRELAHRLKNQLTVINSMARQTARSSDSTQAMSESLSRRIQGLAVGVDLLVSQNWREVPLEPLVRGQLAPFVPEDDRLRIDGPEVQLPPDLTQSVGLALHELATNALKYGAWSVPDGLVTCTWSLAEAGDGRSLTFLWKESGGPPCTSSTRRGFGRVVIEQAAGRGEGASSLLTFEPDGLRWAMTVRFPSP